ncbi:acyltransferase domain-containing protein [Actinomadura barringtoniae]|uniref:[acyl-carrier-protein] S-malonyltransferase n=1 Tax=Actinomadura barringtoniae TaxID=1427535 RepID=A0A939TGN5_9ACTN|nr:acyltransferase domain-containing protein [Actinomadura barringtoniae]MBO2455590.1 acyltransferase domain-containing protein [Actinomadura barringtoniae]
MTRRIDWELAVTGQTAFIFPGRGAYVPGALAGVVSEDVRRTLNELDSVVAAYGLAPVSTMVAGPGAPSLGELLVAAPERIDPAIYATSVCLATILERERGIVPDVVSGHRLGEVAALAVAGVLTVGDGMRVVCEDAAKRFGTPVSLGRPRVRCWSPRTRRYVTSGDEGSGLLYERGAGPVGFMSTARFLYADGITRFVECGARALLTLLTLDCLPRATALTAEQVLCPTSERRRAGRAQAGDW